MKVAIRVAVLAAVSVSVPPAGAAQAPVVAACRAAETMLRELAVPALAQRERAESLRNRFEVLEENHDLAEAEAYALNQRFHGSADSLVSVLVGPSVADSLRSDRIWLGLSPFFESPDDSPARRDSLARADSLMDERVLLHVGSAVVDSMAAATDSLLAAMDRDVEAGRSLVDEGGDYAAFQDTRWGGLTAWRSALEDSLRRRTRFAAAWMVTGFCVGAASLGAARRSARPGCGKGGFTPKPVVWGGPAVFPMATGGLAGQFGAV